MVVNDGVIGRVTHTNDMNITDFREAVVCDHVVVRIGQIDARWSSYYRIAHDPIVRSMGTDSDFSYGDEPIVLNDVIAGYGSLSQGDATPSQSEEGVVLYDVASCISNSDSTDATNYFFSGFG